MKQLSTSTEDILQAELFKYYHNKYCTKLSNPQHIIFAVPNGGQRSKAQAMLFKATGLIAGVADLIVIQPNRIVFIELKKEKGKQSDDQQQFERKVKSLGFEYYLIRSLEQFKSYLEQF
jgi:3-hydroxy-3-methylglutaryl CoA synthase